MSTQDVLNHHLQAFGQGDAAEVATDYTDDAVLVVPDAVIKGKDNIQAFFAEIFGTLFKPGTYDISLDQTHVDGDVAYITWHSKNAGATIPLGTDTFILRGGKITVQTFAAHIVSD